MWWASQGAEGVSLQPPCALPVRSPGSSRRRQRRPTRPCKLATPCTAPGLSLLCAEGKAEAWNRLGEGGEGLAQEVRGS